MANDNSKINDIISLFNDSIRLYNEHMAMTDPENYNVVTFTDPVTKYFTAMENAFRYLLNITDGACKFHELVGRLIDRYPDVLDGIDLFYILRYREDRNLVQHIMEVRGQNPFPRLFLNGRRFIERYLSLLPGTEIAHCQTIANDFDFTDFSQKFSPQSRAYDRVRVLVLGPMHDVSLDKLALLNRFHFNIILDFDPYSAMHGFRACLNDTEVNYIHLTEFCVKNAHNFSRDRVEIVMCDGDKNANIPSFTHGSGYLPSKLDGMKGDCWPNYRNNKGELSIVLLKQYFSAYFQKIPSNVDLLFLMDYSEQTTPEIYNAVTNALGSLATVSAFFIDEINSAELSRQSDRRIFWWVYPTSLHKFLDAVDTRISPPRAGSSEYRVPHDEKEHDGRISASVYRELTERFYLLHNNFPVGNDEYSDPDEDYTESMFKFSRGEDISWRLITNGALGNLDVFSSIYANIKRFINKKEIIFKLTHSAGFGGSTAARHTAYRLSREHPVLFMKSYDKESLVKAIQIVYEAAHRTVVIFVESNILNETEKEECHKSAESTSIPHLIVFVERAPSDKKPDRDGYHINVYLQDDVDRIIRFNRFALNGRPDITKDNKLLSYSAEHFMRELGEGNCSPFLINLSIHRRDFVRLERYVDTFVTDIKERPGIKELFEYLCVFSEYTARGLPAIFAEKFLNVSKLDDFVRRYDALLYTRYDEATQTQFISVRHPNIASILRSKLNNANENAVGERLALKDTLIGIIRSFSRHLSDTDYAQAILRRLFIDRPKGMGRGAGVADEAEEAENTGEVHKDVELIKRFFAPVFLDLWDIFNQELAGSVFDELVREYPKDPFYYVHAARYYAYTHTDFNKADEYLTTAKGFLDDNASIASEVYHAEGMCVRMRFYLKADEAERNGISDINELCPLFTLIDQAAEAFNNSRRSAYRDSAKSAEYARTAWLAMLMRVLWLSDKNRTIPQVQQYLCDARELVYDLEQIYSSAENDDSFSELLRKKQILDNYNGSDAGTQLNKWDNFYDNNKKDNRYENCLYACKQRYFIVEKQTGNFTEIDEKAQERINRLSGEYLHAITSIASEKLSLSDLSIYMTVARYAGVRVSSVSSLINNLFISNPVVDVLFYRYVLRFLQAFDGDRVALADTREYIRDCSFRAKRLFNRTSEFEFFSNGKEMARLISRWHIRKSASDPKARMEYFNYMALATIRGVLRYNSVENSKIIPYDINGQQMDGIEIFVNLRNNNYISDRNNSKDVIFKFGFSYDGLRAHGLSVRPADESKPEVARSKPAAKPQHTNMVAGDIMPFRCTGTRLNDRGDRQGIIMVFGEFPNGERCMMHINDLRALLKQTGSDNDCLPTQMLRYYEHCKKNTACVKLGQRTDKGWVILPDLDDAATIAIFNT